MEKKSLKVKIFFNFYGTYKEVTWAADIYTPDNLFYFQNKAI